MKIKTYIIATILSLLALGAALVFSNVSNAQLSGGGGTIGQLEQWRSLGGYLVPRDANLGLKVPGLATSTTGCLSVASDGIITANGSACGSGSGSGFSTTSANYWKDYVSTLPGLVSFGSSTATTTALGNLTAIGYVQLGTTTTAMLNGVIVVDGVHYPQTGAGIQNAIDVANSRGLKECVFVPSGTYTNATSTIIYSNTCIRGAKDGSTILLGTGNVPTIRTYKNGTSKTTYTNILIEDITIKASYNGLGAHITRLNNIDGLTVRNSRFEHTTTPLSGTPESLYVEHAQNVTLTGNTVFNTAGNGIQVNGVDYFTIANNIISSTTDDAIDVDFDFIDTDTVPSRYGSVVGNVIYGVSGGNGIRVENSEKVTVTGNQISDVRAAGAAGVIVNSTTASVPVSDVVVSANQIYGVYGNGIYVSGSYTTNTLISSNNIASTSLNAGSDVRAGINIASASTTVTGNTINGVGKTNGDSGGIVIYRVNDVNVNNNHISNSSKGINLWNEGFTNDYTGINATGNTFDNVTTHYYGASSSWYKPGVFFSGVVFDSTRSNPKIGYGTTTPGAFFSIGGSLLADILAISSTTASSSFANGINLSSGCFAIGGVCVGSGSGVSGGTANMLAAFTSATAITATGTPAVTAINATSSAATSTLAGGLKLSALNCSGFGNSGKLTVNSSGEVICLADTSGSGSSVDWTFLNNYGSTNTNLTPTTTMPLWARGPFYASSTAVVQGSSYFIGNVGIGASSPGNLLTVLGGDIVLREDDNGNDAAKFSAGNSSGQLSLLKDGAVTVFFDAFGTNPNYIAGGNLGVGTTSPYAKLSIVGSTGVVAEKYTATGTAATSTFAGGLKLSSLNCSGLSNGGALTVNASGEVVCSADDGGAGGTNYWATAGSDVFINTGTSASAPMFNATSTTGTSTFAGGLTVETSGLVYDYSTNNLGVGTAAPAVNLHLYQAATAPYLRIQGASDGDNVGALELWNSAATKKWQFAHQATGNFTFAHYNGGWASPFTIEDDNDILIGSNSLNFNAGGTSGSNYKFAQDADDLMTLQRSGGTDTNYSLLQIKAPAANPTEATIALMTDAGSGNYRFADLYNQQYPTERQWGLRQRYSGTYAATPFMIDFYNGTVKDPMLAIMPSGNVGIGVSTSTLGSSGAAFLVGSTTAPAVFNGNVGIGTTSPYAKLSVVGGVVAEKYTATGTASSTFAGPVQASAFGVAGAWFTNATQFVLNTIAATFNAGATILSFLDIPSAADPTVDAEGEIAINTTAASSSLRFHDGTAERALYGEFQKSLLISTSTILAAAGTLTGTTTIRLDKAGRHPITHLSYDCKTTTGNFAFAFGDGSATTSVANCTTTGTTTASMGANASFILGDTIYIDVGAISANNTAGTIVVYQRYDAD